MVDPQPYTSTLDPACKYKWNHGLHVTGEGPTFERQTNHIVGVIYFRYPSTKEIGDVVLVCRRDRVGDFNISLIYEKPRVCGERSCIARRVQQIVEEKGVHAYAAWEIGLGDLESMILDGVKV